MPDRRAALAALAALAAAALCACAPLPPQRAERNLYLDLRKAVDLSEDTDWIVDAVELEGNAEDALHSVCQVPSEHRANLSAWLGGQVVANGGPTHAHFDRVGDLDDVDEALTLERVRLLLDYADARAPTDCPFWLPPDDDFRGVQGADGEALFLFESIGAGRAILENDQVAVGGGGGGRILAGYAFNRRYTVVSGVELGGAGSFAEKPDGEGGQTIETLFTGAMPLLLRIHGNRLIYDLEMAAVTPLLSGETRFDPGLRFLAGIGVGTMRRAGFMPYLIMWVGYETTPRRSGEPATHALLIGSRVGVDWIP